MSIEAWHFVGEDRCLANGDGRVVVDGEKLTVEGRPVLCKKGLHASVDIMDALSYAPGPVLCRVVVDGTVIQGDNKIVGTERTCLWSVDLTRELREFACDCAERVLPIYESAYPKDFRPRQAIETARRFARGEATSGELAAASNAAWAAAWAAARTAAWAAWAAGAAAWAAARTAAWATWDAARTAAWATWDAARHADVAAAKNAESEWQRALLMEYVEKAREA